MNEEKEKESNGNKSRFFLEASATNHNRVGTCRRNDCRKTTRFADRIVQFRKTNENCACYYLMSTKNVKLTSSSSCCVSKLFTSSNFHHLKSYAGSTLCIHRHPSRKKNPERKRDTLTHTRTRTVSKKNLILVLTTIYILWSTSLFFIYFDPPFHIHSSSFSTHTFKYKD